MSKVTTGIHRSRIEVLDTYVLKVHPITAVMNQVAVAKLVLSLLNDENAAFLFYCSKNICEPRESW